MVLLCDNEGYILETLGNTPFMTKAQQVHLSPGTNWREEFKGTNAIGTSLIEKIPVRVLGWEHFVQENHFLTCSAAPIKNMNGEIVGVLDISGEVGNTEKNNRLLEVAIMGAKMIEQNLEIYSLQRSFQFTKQGLKLVIQMLKEGVIAINSLGLITEINQSGAQMLGRKQEEIIGHLASEVFQASKGCFQNISSSLKPLLDEYGNALGAVGVLNITQSTKETKPFWVGRSDVTRQVFDRASKAAASNSVVMISGESGTGKEIIARYIHQSSPRNDGPFIALNCAALPHSLVESELFGYADGAFTGAKRGGHQGKFELANEGTIFLDEIGDMPLEVQVSLLRVLQEKEVMRIGDTKARKINVRVIAATHKDLQSLVTQGLFRLDLYYRLKVITIDVPSLRNRIDDIFDLIPFFIFKVCQSMGKPPMEIDQTIYKYLLTQNWPGNIRELENCIESMVAMAEGSVLTINDLPAEYKKQTCNLEENPLHLTLLDEQTKKAIIIALNQTKGKIAPAAKILGIGRNTLYRKMHELDINNIA